MYKLDVEKNLMLTSTYIWKGWKAKAQHKAKFGLTKLDTCSFNKITTRLCLAGATLRTPLCVCLSVYSSSISILTRFWVPFFIPCSNCVQMDTNVDTFTNNKIILTYLFYSFFSMHFFIYSMHIGVVSCFFATIHEI